MRPDVKPAMGSTRSLPAGNTARNGEICWTTIGRSSTDVSASVSPGDREILNTVWSEGRRRSASMSRTRCWYDSLSVRARFAAVSVLPSPATALAIMTTVRPVDARPWWRAAASRRYCSRDVGSIWSSATTFCASAGLRCDSTARESERSAAGGAPPAGAGPSALSGLSGLSALSSKAGPPSDAARRNALSTRPMHPPPQFPKNEKRFRFPATAPKSPAPSSVPARSPPAAATSTGSIASTGPTSVGATTGGRNRGGTTAGCSATAKEGAATAVGFLKSKSRHTSQTTCRPTGRAPAAKPPRRALSAMTLIVRGSPRDCSWISVTASIVKRSAPLPPAARIRPATYFTVSWSVSGRRSHRRAIRCLSCRSESSFSRSASSGCPAMMTETSLSSFVSMFARRRTSSRSSSGRLCASSTMRTVVSSSSRLRRSNASSSSSMNVFEPAARSESPKRADSIWTNSDRDSVGLCRCTQWTRRRCRSMAARTIVVFPDPASPMSSVIPFRLPMPYSRLLRASWWGSVSTRNRGFGVRSNGRSRRPKNASYMLASPHERVGEHGETRDHRGAQPEVCEQPEAKLPRVLGHRFHHRHDGQHGQRKQARDVVVGLEPGRPVFKERHEHQSDAQPGGHAAEGNRRTVGADRPVRNLRLVDDVELLADLLFLEIRGDVRFLLALQEAGIGGLEDAVIAGQLRHVRLSGGHAVNLLLVVGGPGAKVRLVVLIGRQPRVDLRDLGLEVRDSLLPLAIAGGHGRVGRDAR